MPKFDAAFRSVMTKRNIEDARIKAKMINKIPQEQMEELFIEMFEEGIKMYIKSEQQKNPDLTPQEIMRKYHMRKRKEKIEWLRSRNRI